jgi:hypothetical protein
MKHCTLPLALAACLTLPGGVLAQSGETVALDDAQMEELVRRSYQYVAMFNVNNKGALDTENPQFTGGYNRVKPNTELADHTLQAISRPNNDTLYTNALIDVTEEPIVLKIPAFDSTYVSLMVTGYDHYVNIPMSTNQGDFDEPATILFYSERTPGYDGEPVEGVDRVMELTCDFVSAVFRVMPHAAEPERLERNLAAMRSIDVEPLSEFLGQGENAPHARSWGSPSSVGRNLDLREDMARFPPYGTDFEIFEERFIEVMQFVVNHTTFDPEHELDAGLLAVLEPLGIAPGNSFDPKTAPEIDGDALRAVAQRVATEELARFGDQDWLDENLTKLFQPKSQSNNNLELLTFPSVIGPIGQPAQEAIYPAIQTDEGSAMNAMHDYEIVMAADEMPPVNAFWSVTLYENETGFFIPNDRFKYSVGENAGFKLNDDGGIRIVIAAEQPEGVPEENWLPINREDMDLDIIMRLYAPDLERYESWTAPKAKKLQ